MAQEQYLQSQIGLRLRSGTDLHRARRQLQLHFDLAEEIVEPRLKIDVHVEVTTGILEHSPAGATQFEPDIVGDPTNDHGAAISGTNGIGEKPGARSGLLDRIWTPPIVSPLRVAARGRAGCGSEYDDVKHPIELRRAAWRHAYSGFEPSPVAENCGRSAEDPRLSAAE